MVTKQNEDYDTDPPLQTEVGQEPARVTLLETHKAIDTLRRFTLSVSSNKQDKILHLTNLFEKVLLVETPNTKQLKATDFFNC